MNPLQWSCSQCTRESFYSPKRQRTVSSDKIEVSIQNATLPVFVDVQEHPNEVFRLAMMAMHGYGREKNPDEALQLLQKAHALGQRDARPTMLKYLNTKFSTLAVPNNTFRLSSDEESFTVDYSGPMSQIVAITTSLNILEKIQINSYQTPEISSKGFIEALKTNTSLKELTLQMKNSQESIDIGKSLESNSTLTALRLAQVTKEGILSLTQSLQSNLSLRLFNLSFSRLDDDGACALADFLKTNPPLQTLIISYTALNSVSGVAIGEALKINSNLTELDVSHNQINDTSAVTIADSLEYNSRLLSLLAYDNDIKVEGANAIAESLRVNSTLQILHIGNNSIGNEGCNALARVLEVNTSLQTLYLENNDIDDISSLGDALTVNTTLNNLVIAENTVGEAEKNSFIQKLWVNSSLTNVVLDSNREISRVTEIEERNIHNIDKKAQTLFCSLLEIWYDHDDL